MIALAFVASRLVVSLESFQYQSQALASSRRVQDTAKSLAVSMSNVPRRSLTLAILDLYFDEVVPLERYLHEILKPSSAFPDSGIPPILTDDEPQSYRDLLKTSYVGIKSDASQRPSFVVTPPMMYMRDVSSCTYVVPNLSSESVQLDHTKGSRATVPDLEGKT